MNNKKQLLKHIHNIHINNIKKKEGIKNEKRNTISIRQSIIKHQS